MKLQLNKEYIQQHLQELIITEDYVPINFKDYNAQDQRDEFLKSKGLLNTIQEMDQLLKQKIEYYKESDVAYNSILIEWVDCHPEFERITQDIKSIDDFNYFDLLYDVELPSEDDGGNVFNFDYDYEKVSFKDDSTIKYPDFKKMGEIHDKFPATLLAVYLSYLV